MPKRDYVAQLKSYEIEVLIDFFMYYMPMERRRQLMAEFPVIYEKLTGVSSSD